MLAGNEHSHVAHSLGGKDDFNKSGALNGGDVISLPKDKLGCHLTLKELKITFFSCHTKSGRPYIIRKQILEDISKVEVSTPNSNDRSLMKVGGEPFDLPKTFEDANKIANISLDGHHAPSASKDVLARVPQPLILCRRPFLWPI